MQLSPIPRSTNSSKLRASATRSGRPTAYCKAGSGTCSSARLADRPMRCDAISPASPIGRRAGASRAASLRRSNGIRASCTRASASSSPTWRDRQGASSPSTTSAARQSSGSTGQERDQMDAAVMPNLRRQRRPPPAARARLQPAQLHADAGDAQGGAALVTDEPAGEADQDWRTGRQPWPLRDVPDGRGRRVAPHVQGHPDAYCPASGATRTSERGARIECDKQRRQGCAISKAKQQVLCATRRESTDSAACGTHRG
jgi:hypothetical protein